MLAAVRCPACDHENPEAARFCVECAAPLARRCAACGTAAPAGAKFCPECAAPLASLSAAVLPAPEPAGGERRQLTILFSDLVGSTELAAGLDPEDWRELVGAYQAAADAVVARFGGHVAQHLGDGLLVYFGWPEAHDDDAERAVARISMRTPASSVPAAASTRAVMTRSAMLFQPVMAQPR